MGIPDRIISDRGTYFTATNFKRFYQENGISLTLNSSRHPQANGQVERVNRTLITTLSMLAEDQVDCDVKVREVERFLNTAVNKTTGETPFKLLHGFSPRFSFSVVNLISKNNEDWSDPEILHNEACDRIKEQQVRMKEYYDARHYRGVPYSQGEVVTMQRALVQGESAKLQRKYRDKPLQVVEVLPGDTYRVVDLTKHGDRSYTTTAHVSQLKSFRIHSKDEDSAPDAEGDSSDNDDTVRVNEAEVMPEAAADGT